MTSKQKIVLPKHPFSGKPGNIFGDPKVLVNSDRVLLNAKEIESSWEQDVNIPTP